MGGFAREQGAASVVLRGKGADCGGSRSPDFGQAQQR